MLTRKKFRSSTVLVVVAMIAVAIIAWQFYKYRIVNRKMSRVVAEKTKGLYSIRYDGLSIDEVGGMLHVKNIEIIPDSVVYEQLLKEGKNPPTLLRISIPALNILGVKTPKALLAKQIEGGKVEVLNPTIEIELEHFSKQRTVYNPGKDISKELLGKLLKIKMDSIAITHAKVIVRDRRSKEISFRSNDVSFLLSDLLIDSVANKDSSRILFSRNMDMSCDEMAIPTKNKKYRLHVEKLRFTGRDNSFYIGSLRLVPQLSEARFASSFPAQKDRYDFVLEGISLRNINRGSLWQKKIEADSLVINKGSFKIFRDLSYPRDTVSKVGKYPQQQLMRLGVPINIRKVIFVNSFIEYKEKNARSDSSGRLQFFHARATIDNVTNMKEAISRDNKCVLFFNARLLNKAAVDTRLVMLFKDPRGKFTIEGNIGAIDALSLNPLLEPMGLARMEKGNITNLHFNFSGTDSSSRGRLTMLYSGIKISLLRKNEKENKYDRKGLASLAANIIMKGSNPGKGGDPRIADVQFNRIVDKSFFNLIWKSIFTGIKETAGIK